VADKETGRLLGLQAAGAEILPRIDAFAVALQAGFTTKDLFFADLAYAHHLPQCGIHWLF